MVDIGAQTRAREIATGRKTFHASAVGMITTL
jgi:hypothetical protein